MSLAADRARVIAASIRRDGLGRRVYVMPAGYTCRVVSIPDGWRGYRAFLTNHGARLAGWYGRGTTMEVLEAQIDRMLDVFHVNPPNPLMESKHQ